MLSGVSLALLVFVTCFFKISLSKTLQKVLTAFSTRPIDVRDMIVCSKRIS